MKRFDEIDNYEELLEAIEIALENGNMNLGNLNRYDLLNIANKNNIGLHYTQAIGLMNELHDIILNRRRS